MECMGDEGIMGCDSAHALAREARKRGEEVALSKYDGRLEFVLPQQWIDEIRVDARSKGLSVSSFMRAMIRGYFGSACRP
jgi:hypothetical protein